MRWRQSSVAWVVSRRRRAGPALGTVAAAILGLASRAAAGEPARLVYERAEGASSCPDEAALRIGVAGRLGYDPFDAGATAPARTVRVSIRAKGDGYAGELELRDSPDGRVVGEKRLVSRGGGGCRELADAMTLAISIAVDPVRAMAAPPGERVPVEGPSAHAAPAADASPSFFPGDATSDAHARDASVAPAAMRGEADVLQRDHAAPGALAPTIAVGGFAASGELPGLSQGVFLTGGMEGRRAGVELEARAALPRSVDGSPSASAEAWLATGSAVPCARLATWAAACAVMTAGRIAAAGRGFAEARADADLYVATGGRVRVDPPVTSALRLRIALDVAAPLTRTSLVLNGRDVWTTAPVVASLSVGVARVGW